MTPLVLNKKRDLQMRDGDFIELGETDLVPIEDGWFLNKRTGALIDAEGYVYDQSFELEDDDYTET